MEFNPKLCVDYVEELIRFDEVERALLVLDNVPAEFRDNLPQELRNLKSQIVGALCTTHAYMSSGLDASVTMEKAEWVLKNMVRGHLIEAEVKRYNKENLKPHVVDIGPGEYFIPLGLERDYNFTYNPIFTDQMANKAFNSITKTITTEKHSEGQPQIFVALEVIEHLPSPQDLAVECLRHCGEWPERIHLSTPKYTYDTKPKDWRKPCGLPHLRTYTPSEFVDSAQKLFPGYHWELYDSQILSLRGQRRDSIDKEPLGG